MPRPDNLFEIPEIRKAWLAGHKNQVSHDDGVSVLQICNNLNKYKRKFSLHVSSVLNIGTARIYATELDELYRDTLKLNKDIQRRRGPVIGKEYSEESTSESIEPESRSGLSPSPHPVATTQSRSTSPPEQSSHSELDAQSSPKPLSTALSGSMKSKHQSSVCDISTGHEVMSRPEVVFKVPGVRKAWLAGYKNKISHDGVSSLETCKVLKKYKRKFSLHEAVVRNVGAARIYDAELDELFQDTMKLYKGIIRRRRPAEETDKSAESTSEAASTSELGSPTECSPQQLEPSAGSTTQSGSTSRLACSFRSDLDSSLQSKSSQEMLLTSPNTFRSSTSDHLSESSTDHEDYSPPSPDSEDNFEQYDYDYEYEDVSPTFTYRTYKEHESKTLRRYFNRRKLSTISEVSIKKPRTSSNLEKCEEEQK